MKIGVLLSAGHQLGERRAVSVRGGLGRISGLKSAEQSFRGLPWMEVTHCFLSFFPEGSAPTAAEFVSGALTHESSCSTRKHSGMGTQVVAAYWRGNWGPDR